jgi:protein gp37
MEESWALNIRDKCLEHKVPFFFKQWGGSNKKAAGRLLQGELYSGMPYLEEVAPATGEQNSLF